MGTINPLHQFGQIDTSGGGGMTITEAAPHLFGEAAKLAEDPASVEISTEEALARPDHVDEVPQTEVVLDENGEPVTPTENDGPDAENAPSGDTKPADEPKAFGDMTVNELKAHAEKHEIDLGDATKKAEIVAAVEAATAETPTA